MTSNPAFTERNMQKANAYLLYWGGRKGGSNTAIPHMVAKEYRNTASKFSQIPKPQLQMGKSWRCQYYKSPLQ